MLDDLILQFFDATPRRPTAVYLLLTGKKTLSILYAAMQHRQLQWLQLYPTLRREDFQAAVARLTQAGRLQESPAGLVSAAGAVDEAAKRMPLPEHYRPWLDVHAAVPRLRLGLQVLSEASYHNAAYRPAEADWSVQQAVRRWWREADAEAAIAELKALLASLPEGVADRLLQAVVGHDYVGAGHASTLGERLGLLDDWAQLLLALDEGAAPQWQALWGGRKALGSPSLYQALAAVQAGASRQQVAARLRRKPSTINENLLIAAIEGAELPLAQLYSPTQQAAFSALPAPAADYHALLAQVPGSDFFQVRLFQILKFQGRWPDA